MESILNLKKSDDHKIIEVELIKPQYEVQMVSANETWLLWGRGTGKSTSGIGWFIDRVVNAMPGHLCGLFGLNFEHLEKNVLPKILMGLNRLGWVDGEDYVYGSKPPVGWPKCLYPIKKFDKTVVCNNGTILHEVSLHEKGSANAFDFQSGVFDEVKFMKQEVIEGEVLPTFRGFENLWSHLPEYLAKIFATDKYADYIKVKWILDKRTLVDHDAVEKIIQLQLKQIEVENYFDRASEYEKKKIQVVSRKLQKEMNDLRKDLVYVSEASAVDNQKNLGQKWFDDKKKLSEYERDVAIFNEDPSKSENGFYPALSEKHKYKEPYANAGYDITAPMIIALDYQAAIAPLDACQLVKLPWEQKITLNFVNEFYAEHPEGLEDAVEKFCNHYSGHRNKLVYYVYDNTAIGRRVSAKKVKDIVVESLTQKNWAVSEIYTGQALDHVDRYQKIKQRMEEKNNEFYPFRFNKDRCRFTLLSLQGAGTKISNGKTKKNKDYENVVKYPKIDQRTTTHFSEVVDQIDYAVNELKMISPESSFFSMGVGLR
jgi:hypothetical protein